MSRLDVEKLNSMRFRNERIFLNCSKREKRINKNYENAAVFLLMTIQMLYVI